MCEGFAEAFQCCRCGTSIYQLSAWRTSEHPATCSRHTELARSVVRSRCSAFQPSEAAHLKKPPAHTRRVDIAEELHGLARDVRHAPEVRFEHGAHVLIHRGLDFPERTAARVVHDDVDAAECLFRYSEGVDDLLRLGDVELQGEETVRRIFRR